MASTTALTLVNKLLHRHGYEDVSVFTAPESVLALDLVNQAIQDLLAERDYPWNIRYDGELFGLPARDGTAFTVLNGFTGFGDTSISGAASTGAFTGRVVARVIVGSSSSLVDYSATSVRISSVAISSGTLSGQLANNWVLNSAVGVVARYVTYEYVLPDVVSKIISMRNERTPLRVFEVDANHGFDEIFPRPWETSNDYPTLAAYGGQAVGTYDSVTSTGGVKGLRLMLWPVPNRNMLLSYSYKERLPSLTTVSSTIDVPDEFVGDIINRAEALSNMTQRYNDPDLAAAQMRNSLISAERKYTNAPADPGRRNSLRPHDATVRRRDPTNYRDVTGL